MLLAVAYNQVLATITAFTIGPDVTLSATLELTHFIVLLSSAAAAVIPLSSVASRSKIVDRRPVRGRDVLLRLRWGWTRHRVADRSTRSSATGRRSWHSAWGAAMCLAASYPRRRHACRSSRRLFDVVTDISLLELSDPSHPLLQELVRRAPGTYNHSITVGSIAEAAAEAIGANGLLVRVGAYFHDIGKMLKPQYFIENIQEGTREPALAAGPGDEHADHHRPREGRHRPGRAAQPAAGDHRLHRAAPRHDAGRVLLPRSGPAGGSGIPTTRPTPKSRRSAIPAPSRSRAKRAS